MLAITRYTPGLLLYLLPFFQLLNQSHLPASDFLYPLLHALLFYFQSLLTAYYFTTAFHQMICCFLLRNPHLHQEL